MFLLLKALDALFESEFENAVPFRVPEADPGEYKAPAVYIGGIPPRRKGDDKEGFPYIVNRIVSGNDSAEKSIAVVHTLCGSYTAGGVEDGENDILNMAARCRALILGLENGMLDQRFMFEYPLKWHMGSTEAITPQPYPYYGATLVSQWVIPATEFLIPLNEQKEIYGYLG